MIYVRRDPALIPEKVLKVAERAQAALEALPPEERVAFIKNKSHIWRGFKKYLARMSYGKCWYSESPDPQSFFDVDHFRPKAEARRSDTADPDEGYPWLAFSWENFRFSAGRSNRLSTDEHTDETVGKGSWFPLCQGSPVAEWAHRNVVERPMLLDPVNSADMDLIRVESDGSIKPSYTCVGTNASRVKQSIELYGLDLPRLTEARLRIMRDVQQKFEALLKIVAVANDFPLAADPLPVQEQAAAIKATTMPDSPYSLAARCKLIELGGADLIARPEDYPPVQSLPA
ncbi:hypothetical protein ACK6D9_05770 [Hoeflea sp. Naph1]|uniref:hypothetical protein n=1 Tax=Hoeflea sp. Naph1 TaxID=3388653 RepID=UPI00398FCC80